MNKFERAVALLPFIGAIPQVVKEDTVSAPLELNVARAGITVILSGIILYTEAMRQRQMEAGHKIDRDMSSLGVKLIALGFAAVSYGLWGINKL